MPSSRRRLSSQRVAPSSAVLYGRLFPLSRERADSLASMADSLADFNRHHGLGESGPWTETALVWAIAVTSNILVYAVVATLL